MVLSDYVFDGSAASGLINLNNGLFHFTSNGKPDQGVKLRTPVATIGVRGTEFLVHVDGTRSTIIDILSGAVEATPHGTGKSVVCVEGQSILIAGENDDALCGDHWLVLDRGRSGRQRRRQWRRPARRRQGQQPAGRHQGAAEAGTAQRAARR